MTDPFLPLEQLDSAESLSWVEAQNKQTLMDWSRSPRFQALNERALQILSQPHRLTMGQVFRGEIYHLWQDSRNPLGIWRKTPLQGFGVESSWTELLNLDELSKEQGQSLFLKTTQFLKGSSRVLLSLSPDGKDASEVKEWDLETGDFVPGGFATELNKDHLAWVEADHVLWFSTENPTHCGYSSKVYSWKRGQEPELILQVPTTSMDVWGQAFEDADGAPQIFIFHALTWDEIESFHWSEGRCQPTGLPLHARIIGLHQGRLVIGIEKNWDHLPKDSALIAKSNSQRTGFTADDFEVLFCPEKGDVCQDICLSRDEIAIFHSDNLKNRIRMWRQGTVVETAVPEAVTVGSLYSSVEKDMIFTSFQSFTEPPGWYQWKDCQWQVLQKAPAYFTTENVVSRQEWAVSRDGTEVPYWVVYDQRFQFPRHTLQYGYGGFQASMFPSYSALTGALWIEGGGLYVLAQIRGGSEFGVEWHQAAKGENKQKSYDDFIAVSEDLIRKGFTTPAQLGIQGRSNGGLLVGATVVQRPDLYGAAVIEVPLLDMIRYVELPPGSSWIGEYGDPRDPKFREAILKYSPYQNVSKNAKYPPILIRTARSDDRVHPGHARKMAARLQSLGHDCWFFEESLGGHGSTPVREQAFQSALVFEFLLTHLARGSG